MVGPYVIIIENMQTLALLYYIENKTNFALWETNNSSLKNMYCNKINPKLNKSIASGKILCPTQKSTISTLNIIFLIEEFILIITLNNISAYTMIVC